MSTVLDRYGHRFPGSEDKVNDALDALTASVEPPGQAGTVHRLPNHG